MVRIAHNLRQQVRLELCEQPHIWLGVQIFVVWYMIIAYTTIITKRRNSWNTIIHALFVQG